MISRRVSGVPRTLPLLVFALGGLPLIALGILGWRFLEQDRALEAQRQRDRAANAATLVAHDLDRRLSAWDDMLETVARGDRVTLPDGAAAIVFNERGIVARAGMPALYYPVVSEPDPIPAETFADAERLEIANGDPAGAAVAYRRIAATAGDPRVRAAALVRLARCLRAQLRFSDALIVYDTLRRLGSVRVAGAPAELVASRERAVLFGQLGDDVRRSVEEGLLSDALSRGRFPIDRPTFEFFSKGVAVAHADQSARRIAAATASGWPRWRQAPAGRAAWLDEDRAYVSVWRNTSSGTAALLAPLDSLVASAAPLLTDLQVTVAFEDDSRRRLAGTLDGDDDVTRATRETGLPWTLRVALVGGPDAGRLVTSRRNLMAAGFALMMAVVTVAGYVVLRAVNREVGVAQLQSDFLAAVSHEFRTPLTAMGHLTELLEEGGQAPDRLPHYYRALAKETRRLHALVEGLLDFGRTEAGARVYRQDDLDLNELIATVVSDHSSALTMAAGRLMLSTGSSPCLVRGDQQALALVVRNLIDNALKYSAGQVDVSVRAAGTSVEVAVHDCGPGIPSHEQREVFRKFVRGSSARTLEVAGTGIGLTMARHIAEAHRGRLRLASEPGHGSTFTVSLPALTSQMSLAAGARGPVAEQHPS